MTNATHAVVTLVIRDMDGFAPLGKITVAQYEAAPEGPRDVDANHGLVLDLWSREGHFDDKWVSLETAAGLLGWPADTLIQRGRQILAQINDEALEWLADHLRASAV